jgi:long-chain fatty acid transport protein
MIMKFAPSISYQATPDFSVGAALHVDYATLDLGNGSSPAYGVGGQFGAIYRPTKHLSLGATYVTPQSTDFGNVVATPTGRHDLELESPHQVAAGVSYGFLDDRLLVELDGKYFNWSGATGYQDFGWVDQWVAAIGAQYEAIHEKLFVRAGYNYGTNPVDTHNVWGTGVHNVQGMQFPDYYYETFRIIGFPAIVEHHVTFRNWIRFLEEIPDRSRLHPCVRKLGL